MSELQGFRPLLEAVEGLLEEARTGHTSRGPDEISLLEAIRDRIAREIRDECGVSPADS